MAKLLGLCVIGAGSFYGYKKLTEFATNITIENKDIRSCLFRKIDRHIVTTDKGEFLWQNKVKRFDFGPNLDKFVYNPFVEMEEGNTYHVTGYGLDLPKLHLHRIIVSANGTPCDNNHCEERPSFLSKVLDKF
jgi:hypothetical protein